MSKKIHIPVDTMNGIVTKLGIDSTSIIGMLDANDASSISTVLLSENMTIYNKLYELLETDSNKLITDYKNKKGYILPGGETTIDKLNIICKSHDIKIAKDLNDADFIITNDNVVKKYTDVAGLSKISLMFELENHYSIQETKNSFIDNLMSEHYIKEILYDAKCFKNQGINLYNCEYDSLCYNSYIYTGLALQVLEKMHDGMSSISSSRLIDESPNQQILTFDLYNTIINMYNGGADDRNLLTKLLPTIRVDKNHHLLWELAQKLKEYNLDTRDKDLKYWWYRKFSELDYGRKSAEDFVLEKDQDNTLTSIEFKYMEPQIRKEISISYRELYTFKVEIKPEYKKYYEKQL